MSIANIPIQHNTPDVEEALPFTRIYNPTRAVQFRQPDNVQTAVAQVHYPDVQTSAQTHQNSLYPDLQGEGMQGNSGRTV